MLSRPGAGPGASPAAPAFDPLTRAVLDAVPSAMAALDAHGHIVVHNAAWTALGQRTGVYGDLGSLVTPADKDGSAYLRRLAGLEGPLALPARRLARAAQDALAGRTYEACTPYRMRRPEGEDPFEAVLTPLPSKAGPLLLIQHVDVGAAARAEEVAALAVEKGLEAEELRTRLRRTSRRLARISQDLHTPVTPVRLELHLLHSGALGPLTPAQDRALSLAERNVQRWADGEQGLQRVATEIPDTPTALDLSALVGELVEARQTEALQAGVRLVVSSPGRTLPVHASVDLVAAVLDRFLDHALGASSSGATVSVELAARGDEAVVEVLDSGSGRSARDLRSVLEPWGGRRPAAGAELGLYHARLEAEKAGGRVWAESDGPGQGLLLGLALPLLKSSGLPPALRGA